MSPQELPAADAAVAQAGGGVDAAPVAPKRVAREPPLELPAADAVAGATSPKGTEGPVRNLVSGTQIGYIPQPTFLTETMAWMLF